MAILFTGLWLAGFIGALVDAAHHSQIAQATSAWLGSVNRRQLWVMALGCLFLVAISAVGGYGYQGRDWEKHSLILNDLVEEHWPVYHNYSGEQVGLVYYIAYYLPAALVGKLGGIWLAHHALTGWTLVGLLLSILWCALVIFTLFSGLSAVGAFLRFYVGLTILTGTRDRNQLSSESLLDTWAPGMKHSSNVTGLFWSPQHFIAGWVITAMLLLVSMTGASRKSSLFLAGLSALWSPFVTLGLTPFVLADLFAGQQISFLMRVRRYVSIPNFSGLAILCLTGVYYATKLKPIAALMNSAGVRGGTVFTELDRWDGPVQFVTIYLLFCFLAFGVYFLLGRCQAFVGMPAIKTPISWFSSGWLPYPWSSLASSTIWSSVARSLHSSLFQ